MKRAFLFILSIVFAISSCADSTIKKVEASIKSKIISAAGDVPLGKFKTESISFADTVTVSDAASAIMKELEPYYFEKDLEQFTKYRNQEFKEFRRDPSYEEAVMRGNLKDASAWCTEIRVVTEKADSLIANWDSVSPYDYDYIYLNLWYVNRMAKFYRLPQMYYTAEAVEQIAEFKPDIERLRELSRMGRDEVLYYIVDYSYSFDNPIVKSRVKISKEVNVSPDMEVLEMKDKGFEVL